MIGTFSFEGANAAFGQGIVVRISSTAHRDGDAVVGQQLLVGYTRILLTPVSVMQPLA